MHEENHTITSTVTLASRRSCRQLCTNAVRDFEQYQTKDPFRSNLAHPTAIIPESHQVLSATGAVSQNFRGQVCHQRAWPWSR